MYTANPFETQLERLARTLTTQFGVQVSCCGDQAWTDGRHIRLPSLPDPLEENLERMMVGFLDHEMAHVAFSDFSVAKAFNVAHPGHEALLNAVEDGLIERQAMHRWPGVRANLDAMFQEIRDRVATLAAQRDAFGRFCTAVYPKLSHHKDMIGLDQEVVGYDDLLDRFPKVRSTRDAAELSEALLQRWLSRQPTQQSAGQEGQAGEDGDGDSGAPGPSSGQREQGQPMQRPPEQPGASDAEHKQLNEDSAPEDGASSNATGDEEDALENEDDGDSAGASKTATSPPGSDASDTDGDSEGDAGDDNGTRQSGNTHDEDSDASGEDAESASDDAEDDREDGADHGKVAHNTEGADDVADPSKDGTQGAIDQQPGAPPNTTSAASPTSFGQGGTLVAQALAEAIAEAIAAISPSDQYRVFTKAHDRIEVVPSAKDADVRSLMETGTDVVRRLRRSLADALRSAEKRWWRDDQTRGHLSPRTLYRLCTDRARLDVFRTRSLVQGKSTAVCIVLDASGSMTTQKMGVARQSMRVLLEALSDLHIATEAFTFTTGDLFSVNQAVQDVGGDVLSVHSRYSRFGNLEIGLIKRFEEPVKAALGRLPSIKGTGLTPLGEAMQIGASRLVVRPETRKIMVVLTDGRAGCEGGGAAATLHAHHIAERCRMCGIELIGVGIQDASLCPIVKDTIVIHVLEELPAQLCKLLGRTLQKGVRQVG